MQSTIHVTRSPQGEPLDPEALAILRALLAEQSARKLTVPLGVSITALTRAAAGLRVLAGTRALIRAGIERMGVAGELPPPPPATPPPARGGRR